MLRLYLCFNIVFNYETNDWAQHCNCYSHSEGMSKILPFKDRLLPADRRSCSDLYPKQSHLMSMKQSSPKRSELQNLCHEVVAYSSFYAQALFLHPERLSVPSAQI
jgi:hypothetical protein